MKAGMNMIEHTLLIAEIMRLVPSYFSESVTLCLRFPLCPDLFNWLTIHT